MPIGSGTEIELTFRPRLDELVMMLITFTVAGAAAVWTRDFVGFALFVGFAGIFYHFVGISIGFRPHQQMVEARLREALAA